jgi:predicted ATP-grasp superfamily ATP-dependent carboligase
VIILSKDVSVVEIGEVGEGSIIITGLPDVGLVGSIATFHLAIISRSTVFTTLPYLLISMQ